MTENEQLTTDWYKFNQELANKLDFISDLTHLINKYSYDNECNTNDFLVAQLLWETYQTYCNIKKQNDQLRGK